MEDYGATYLQRESYRSVQKRFSTEHIREYCFGERGATTLALNRWCILDTTTTAENKKEAVEEATTSSELLSNLEDYLSILSKITEGCNVRIKNP